MAFRLPLPRLRWTISGRIVFAFVAMSVVSIALGVITVMGADRAARMVRLTYDDVLVSNNYARAAAGDFANLRAHAAEQLRSGSQHKDPIDPIEAALRQSFQADLATAVEKAGAADVIDLAGQLRAAEAAWVEQSHKLGAKPPLPAIVELDAKTRAVEDKVEALVSRVTERGFAYREQARAMVDRDAQFAMGGVAAAIACAGCVALLLSRRISKPIGQAARFAGQIAGGSLDGEPPAHGSDEVGDLIEAMIQMRGNIAAMMSKQTVLQEQSQARVVGALEDCEEGIVVIDPLGVVQIANRRALDHLGLLDDPLPQGETIEALMGRVQRRDPARIRLLQVNGKAHEIEEIALPDGRWIRSSRQITSEGGLVALYTDITAIKDQQERLGEANVTLDAALGNMSQGLCLFDAANRLKLANTRFRALSGLTASQCTPGTPYRDIVAQALVVAGGNTAGLDRLMRHERAVIRRRRATDRSIVLGARTIAITQSPMADGGWLATYEDVTERKRAETQIAFLANHDALTHLPNRTMFGKKVEEAIVRARRGTAFAIHCLDLDHFKQVNDTLGHAFGDQLLRAVTDRLLGCVREIDTVARLGGDEFAVLQADVTSPEQVATLAQRMVEALAAPYVIEGHDIMIAASVGIALSPGDGLTHGLLLKSADAALYKSKEEGRRTWRFFESAMDESLQARHALEADLRRALQNEEFEVFFQPLLDARNAQIASFEALVRWRHPIRGLVPPDQFIPIAEETGAIKDIGIWVLNAACREATRWPSHMRVAVNVSTIQLREADFAQTVTSALARSGLPADRLELEITESVFMANTTKIMPILTGLRGIGVRFAMDDFGTGYSSLSTLRAFPFDKIKIDRSFIRDLSAAEAAGQIIRTILALGRSLGMRVTAEGVETRAQLEFLEQEGCDEIQGYLVGRPMPAGEVIERLARDSDRGWMNRAA